MSRSKLFVFLFTLKWTKKKAQTVSSTTCFSSSVLGYLTLQHTLRKAMHRLESTGSERFCHFLKVTGEQQDKDATLGLYLFSALFPLPHSSEKVRTNNKHTNKPSMNLLMSSLNFIFSPVGRNLCYFLSIPKAPVKPVGLRMWLGNVRQTVHRSHLQLTR